MLTFFFSLYSTATLWYNVFVHSGAKIVTNESFFKSFFFYFYKSSGQVLCILLVLFFLQLFLLRNGTKKNYEDSCFTGAFCLFQVSISSCQAIY